MMSDTPHRTVSRRRFLTSTGVAGALALAGCTEGPGSTGTAGSGLSGSISISGSSTVFPVVQAVTEQFKKDNPDVEFSLNRTGTGGGFSNQFCPGNSDFNNGSRPISSEEEQLCADSGVEYQELEIATDALTVIVNNDNDDVDCVTPDELRELWRSDGPTNWSDVNDSWPDAEIVRYGAADTSGTFDYFREEILGEDTNHTSDYSATENDNSILQGVQNDEHAIGYFGFAYYQDNSDSVTALKIDNGDGCIAPSLETAKNNDYQPLSRSLFTYPSKSSLAKEHVAEFARYYVKKSADEDLIRDIGYVPKTQEDMQAELDTLNEVISDVQ